MTRMAASGAAVSVSSIFHPPETEYAQALALGAILMQDGGLGIPRNLPKSRFQRWLNNAPQSQMLPSPPAMSLGNFLKQAASVLEINGSPAMEVACEIEEAYISQSGNAYLRLRDGMASCRALTWRINVEETFGKNGLPQVGDRGVAVVFLELSPEWGLRLLVSHWQTSGNGEEKRRREGLSKLIEDDGLMEARRKWPLPAWLHHAVILAPDGAGLEDMNASIQPLENEGLLRLERRLCSFEGLGASQMLSNALQWAATTGADAVVMVRGGGAPSSLSWLDDERILRAAAALPMPLITGLGHERDHPLLERLAAKADGTPSKAAHTMVQACIGPLRRVDENLARIENAAANLVTRARERADQALRRTMSACPTTVLARGYAVVHDMQGKLVTAPVKGKIIITFQDSTMEATA